MQAIVLKSAKRNFECLIIENHLNVKAAAFGNLLKSGNIVVGDNVILKQENNEWMIVEILPRKNEIYRMLIRENKKKVVASNCDAMVIINSVSKPEYKRGLLDRFLVRACQWGIKPYVVFNKMDQLDVEGLDIYFEASRLSKLGAKCYDISAKVEDYNNKVLKYGINDLAKDLTGKTAILMGQSGVGKSKTITRLNGGKQVALSADVGKKGKGVHTTTWAEIIDCGSFLFIDSPGIRSYSLDDINPDELLEYFPDLEEIAVTCKFSNCAHQEDSKGCSFWSDKFTENEKLLLHSRLESFCRIKSEISQTPQWAKKY
ncbi:MAG: ribosome small subunit-dependent GTPase A [Halobacteriovoraceae bacterium]|nr:ribosome small subunit-dependent GTPase A [Halobacteriovoraceae bacterium]